MSYLARQLAPRWRDSGSYCHNRRCSHDLRCDLFARFLALPPRCRAAPLSRCPIVSQNVPCFAPDTRRRSARPAARLACRIVHGGDNGRALMNGFQYINTFGSARTGFAALPPGARLVVGLAAIPGLVLLLLSVLMIVVSIIALLLLTVPVYRLMKLVSFSGSMSQQEDVSVEMPPSPGRRQVDAKVIE